MIGVKVICVGKLKEKFYLDAVAEYQKRLGAYCDFTLQELPEVRLPEEPSAKEIAAALEKEAGEILKNVPRDAWLVAMCVEGKAHSSEALAKLVREREGSGKPKMCFVIGSSFGLSDTVKQRADLRLSMSAMTFPHHLARVMLVEQIYRSFKINEGSRYHK